MKKRSQHQRNLNPEEEDVLETANLKKRQYTVELHVMAVEQAQLKESVTNAKFAQILTIVSNANKPKSINILSTTMKLLAEDGGDVEDIVILTYSRF